MTRQLELRWCDDIGMFSWDRDKPSCRHKTVYCEEHCYNNKLYNVYHNMYGKDVRNEKAWMNVSGVAVRQQLDRKRKQVQRVRGCTRGENIRDFSDINRIIDLANSNPDTTFWLPTRAWRDPLLASMIKLQLWPLDNVVVNASLDPSNSIEEWIRLEQEGWSLMFFGDDSMEVTPLGSKLFKCPKTFKKLNGHCVTCKAGCFSKVTKGKPSYVILSEH